MADPASPLRINNASFLTNNADPATRSAGTLEILGNMDVARGAGVQIIGFTPVEAYR